MNTIKKKDELIQSLQNRISTLEQQIQKHRDELLQIQ